MAVMVGSDRAASSLALELVACDHTRDEGGGSALVLLLASDEDEAMLYAPKTQNSNSCIT